MGANVSGIYQYDGSDAAAPTHTLLNKLGDSVRTLIASLDLTGTVWTAPALTGGWSAFGAPFRGPAYSRRLGRVWLRGAVKSGGVGSANAIFTLPAGYRPAADEAFEALANTGPADLRVDSLGRVYVAAYHGTGTNGVVSLSGISFVADGS